MRKFNIKEGVLSLNIIPGGYWLNIQYLLENVKDVNYIFSTEMFTVKNPVFKSTLIIRQTNPYFWPYYLPTILPRKTSVYKTHPNFSNSGSTFSIFLSIFLPI